MYIAAWLCFCATLGLFTVEALADEKWQLVTQEQGVAVYSMPVKGSKINAVKGVIRLAKGQTLLAKTILDVQHWPDWVPDVVESNVIEHTEHSQTYYVKSALPWPMTDRDGAYHSILSTNLSTNGQQDDVIINIVAMPNAVPRKKNTIRVESATGSWLLQQDSELSTKVSFQMHIDPGGDLPEWLVNNYVEETAVNTLLNLKRFVSLTSP